MHYKVKGDFFDHFENLSAEKKIPSFEELERDAKAVYRAFCTAHAGERALGPVDDTPEDADEHANTLRWRSAVPLGSAWRGARAVASKSSASTTMTSNQAPSQDCSLAGPGPGTPSAASALSTAGALPTAEAAAKRAVPEPFIGDRVLSNSIDFMAESISIREFLYACAEGDPGRVYECMKVCQTRP